MAEIELKRTDDQPENEENQRLNDIQNSETEGSETDYCEISDQEENGYASEENETQSLSHVNQSKPETPRRSARERKPVIRNDFISYLAVEGMGENPTSMEEVMKSPQKEEWIQAMKREIHSLQENDTWEISDMPKGATILGTKWVYKQKIDDERKPKARLVIQGCKQTEGVNYEETFALVALISRYSSIRYLIALTVQKDFYIAHLDVETAYLYSELEEDIYISSPKLPGKNKYSGKILKLRKAVYGLKQSGRNWNIKLDAVLRKEGLKRLKSDSCIYMYQKRERTIIVAVYVDDLLIFSNNKNEIRCLKENLRKQFKIRDLGEVSEFLGIKIERDYAHGTLLYTKNLTYSACSTGSICQTAML
ncbi:unnamed protein product [Lasius platythorax]|uniref:Reverse transcriptase Ty1/copia-type domain-containing protein n=1 Tax=Lasius platythorax TaxID=488582 RepID=A0AAV2NFI0_9HYME